MAQALIYEVTNVGLVNAAALVEAGKTIEFVKIAIGTGNANAGYAPTGGEAALKGEFARFPITSLSRAGKDLFFEAIYDGPAQGWIREVGLFIKNTAGQDTLFAIWSSTEFNLGHKSQAAPYLFKETVTLARIPVDKVNVTALPPSLQLLFVTPIAILSAEILRAHRLGITAERKRATPIIEKMWR